ncbi:uncharacterized protein VP01_12108g1, partial [Puccinia sorghi]
NRKKVLYAASYLGGRASQWFEPYLDLLENQSPSCLINNWDRFKQKLFTLFGDPNEASTYIAQFRTLQLRINWNNSNKKADSTPSTSKNEDASKYKKKFPAKPFTPSASTLAPRLRKPTEIASVLNKEGKLNSEEKARREREGLC